MIVGDATQFTCTVKDANGNLVDPANVVALVHRPDNVNDSPLVLHVSTGVFSTVYQWLQPGQHVVRFTGALPYPFITERVQIVGSPLF